MRRRGFLQLGLLGGALLSLSGVGLALFPSRRVFSPRRALAVLDAGGFNVLAAIAARVLPIEGADPVAIAHGVDDSLALQNPEAQSDFRNLLKLVENGLAGLLLDGRPRPFTRLGPGEQDAALIAFRESRLVLRRSGYHALRKLCSGVYYSDERSWAGIAYPGPPAIAAP